jgi:hypothetical protein
VIVGEVRSVGKGGSQTELVAAAAAGALALSVEMAEGNFHEDGGQLRLNDNTYDYDTIDVDADTITLTAPLPVAAEVDDPVQAVDAGAVEVAWTAEVAIDDGDPIAANIPTSLIGYFPEGVYDQPVQVAIELRGDTYEVASQPLRDASFDGGTVWNPNVSRDMFAANIPNITYTKITSWSAGTVDGITVTSGDHTIVYPGIYFFAAAAAFVANATGRRRVRVLVNGVQVAYNAQGADDSGAPTYTQTFREVRLEELDVVTVEVWQDSGAVLGLYTTAGVANFSIHRVSV